MARVLSPKPVGVARLVSTGLDETATDFVENRQPPLIIGV